MRLRVGDNGSGSVTQADGFGLGSMRDRLSDQGAKLFAALRAGASGCLPKTMNLGRLPDTLNGVCNGETAMARKLMTRVLERFRRREPHWWQTVSAGQAQWRLTSREWEVFDLLAQGRSTTRSPSGW